MTRCLLRVAFLIITGCAAASVSTTLAAESFQRHGDHPDQIIVESDRIERFDNDRLLVFIGNVVARRDNFLQYADRIELRLDEAGNVVTATSIGNVRIITVDCRKGTARWAEYRDLDSRVVLSGNARVWPDQGFGSGEDIFLYLPRGSVGVRGDCSARTQ